MGHTIAIDFGTTFCSIAVPEQRDESGFQVVSSTLGCSVILDRFGRSRIPALVGKRAGRLLIGSDAARAVEAGTAIRFAKRHIGQDSMGPGQVSPGHAIADLFRGLKLTAEERLGDAVTSTVLAVPAHFSLGDIQLIRQAAAEAELNLTQVVSEPVATALAYSAAHHPGVIEPLQLLVCNVGGGSFEATILEKCNDAVTVLAAEGDPCLGGCDFDEVLANWIADQLCSQGYDLNLDRNDEEDQRILRRLMVYAERVKVALSSRDSVELVESTPITDHSGEPVGIDVEITRDTYESVISRQVERMLDRTSSLFERASSSLQPIEIVLTGGASRTPLIARRLKERFGITPKLFEPDLAVVLGTALVARAAASEAEWPRGSEQLARAISVMLEDGSRVIAPEGARLPLRTEIQFHTAADAAPIRVPLVDGEQHIGEIVVEGAPPELPVGSKVDIHLTIGDDFGVETHALVEGVEIPSSFVFGKSGPSADQTDSRGRPDPAAGEDASSLPPAALILLLTRELRGLELRALNEGRFKEFAREFAGATDSLKAIDPGATQSLGEIQAWVYTRFRPLRNRVLATDALGFSGGGSGRSHGDASWAQFPQSLPTDSEQESGALEYSVQPKGPEDRSNADDPQQKWLAKANRAVEAGDWDDAIGYATMLMRDPAGCDRDDIQRRILAPSLAKRGVERANRAVDAINRGVSDPARLQTLVEDLRAADRDVSDAARLAPLQEDLRRESIRIRRLLDQCEVERIMAEAGQAIEREDWDSAVARFNEWLRAAPESDKPSIQQHLARCLINRASSKLRFVGDSKGATQSEAASAIESAVNDLNEALRLDPSNRDAARHLTQIRSAIAGDGLPTLGDKTGKGSTWLGRMFGKTRRTPQRDPGVIETHKITEPLLNERRGAPEVPGAVDNVHFSVTAPTLVLPGSVFILTVWAYLERQRSQVIERTRQELGGGEIYIQSKGPAPIPKGAVLTVRLNVEGLSVEDGEDTILWTGEIGEAGFPVRVPQDAAHGAKHGRATIHIGGLQIAKIHFAIQVGARPAASEGLQSREERHRTAFASYASEDRDRVVARVQGLKKAGVDVFMDIVNLRAGELWEQALWREIPARDIFYLFWSEHAARSEYVEKEWRYALQTRGLEFIDPVPLVSPDVVKPPAELAGKHFNDALLAFMKSPSQ